LRLSGKSIYDPSRIATADDAIPNLRVVFLFVGEAQRSDIKRLNLVMKIEYEPEITLEKLDEILMRAKERYDEVSVLDKTSPHNLNKLQIGILRGGGPGLPHTAFTASGHDGKTRTIELANVSAIEWRGKRYTLPSQANPF
jgi:hypothetical protein